MTELEKLKQSYPTAFYQDGEIWLEGQDDKPFVNEQDTKAIINEHYDGYEITQWSGKGDSRDPREEVGLEVDGYVYIQEVLAGDYEKAFKEA
mgnify:CR=1 FL=1